MMIQSFRQTARTLSRYGRCTGRSESSLGANAVLLVLSWCTIFSYALTLCQICCQVCYCNQVIFSLHSIKSCLHLFRNIEIIQCIVYKGLVAVYKEPDIASKEARKIVNCPRKKKL